MPVTVAAPRDRHKTITTETARMIIGRALLVDLLLVTASSLVTPFVTVSSALLNQKETWGHQFKDQDVTIAIKNQF